MEIDNLKRLIIRLSIIGIVCVALLGISGLLTNIFLDVNYLNQSHKYSSLKIGMSKEEIQHILGKGGPILKLPPEIEPNKESDDVWSYSFRLGSESGGYFVVYYKDGKLIEKTAFADGAPLFTENREGKTRTGSVLRIFFYIVVTLIGISPLWICMKIARGNSLLQNKDNALLEIIICMVVSLGVLVLLGLIDLSNGFEVVSIMG